MIRQAKLGDVGQIVALLTTYAQQGLLLPRSHQSVCETLLAFRVVEQEGMIVGAAALHLLGDDLAEIRSLAVSDSAQGKGLGRMLVKEICALAKELDVQRVLALTYEETFFRHCGFHVIEKSSLHQKIWKDCIHCKKFPVCDEIAMIWLNDSSVGTNGVPQAV